MTSHITSKELSERLKKLGVAQKSEFYWAEYMRWKSKGKQMVRAKNVWLLDRWGSVNGQGNPTGKEVFSAFLASELGEMLPRYCEVTFRQRAEDRVKLNWNCDGEFNETEASTLPEALGLMLEYLLINKLI